MTKCCLVLAPRKIPCRYGRLIERLLLKVIAKQSLVLPMYLRHFKTLLRWPRPDRPCVHLTIVWWTWPLWKPVPCQRWHWHGWELWRSGTLGCQLLSLTWSRPRWLTLGSGAIQKGNQETISVVLVQGTVIVDALRSIWAGQTWWWCCDILWWWCDILYDISHYPSLSRWWWCCDISFIIPAASTQSDDLALDFAQPQSMDSFSWIHGWFQCHFSFKTTKIKKLLTYKTVMA